jgi:multiple sugar transport system permease protein
LPLSGPPLATLAVFNFLGVWNDFMWPLIMTHSERLWMLNVGLSYFQEMYLTNWPLLMAGAVMALLPVLAVYVAAQRYLGEYRVDGD